MTTIQTNKDNEELQSANGGEDTEVVMRTEIVLAIMDTA